MGSNPTVRAMLDGAFQARKDRIISTLRAVESRFEPQNYDQFAAMYPITDHTSQVILGTNSIPVYSGGTLGPRKEFHFPISELINTNGMGNWKNIIANARNPAILYSRNYNESCIVDILVITNTVKAFRDDIKVVCYKNIEQAIQTFIEHDVVLIETSIMAYRALHYGLMISKMPTMDTQLLLDMNSERVTAMMISKWCSGLLLFFRNEPQVTVSYSQNDTGLIGLYDYYKGHKESDLRYKVTDKRFVEVIDNKIIITTLRTEGSVLIRYNSGDTGVLTTDYAGNIYLSNIGRGALDAGLLYDTIEALIRIPFQLEVHSDKFRFYSFEWLDLNNNLIPLQNLLQTEIELVQGSIPGYGKGYLVVSPHRLMETYSKFESS